MDEKISEDEWQGGSGGWRGVGGERRGTGILDSS